MLRFLALWLVVFLSVIALHVGVNIALFEVYADPPPICCNQPSTDQFEIAPYGNLDQYNPLSKKVRAQGVVRWAYVPVSGCPNTASLGQTVGKAMGNIYDETGTVFVYVDDGSAVDLKIYGSCGSAFAAVCGGGGVIGCLGRSFPYVLDIDLHTDMEAYFEVSKVSIVLHELWGHALQTANEGYCTGVDASIGCTGRFAAVPGYVSVMNTGPDSRHYLAWLEAAMWGRTMGSGAPARVGKGDGFVYFCNVSAKATGVALYGWDGSVYRYVGLLPLSALPVAGDGCRGLGTNGYIRADETPCIQMFNAVDTKRWEYRSDRCA